MDKLLATITKVIASPHTTITEHDERRALQVLLGIDDFLIDNLPGYCDGDCQIDFGAYASEKLKAYEK